MAKNFAVIGSPIEHSKSPAIHEAAYRMLDLDWTYSKANVSLANFETFMLENLFDGLSVTMPLKEAAFRFADASCPLSRMVGAANTLVKSTEGWLAYNTDIFGITRALDTVKFDSVLILGSGATARNAVVALSEIEPNAKISIQGRNAAKADLLVSWAQGIGIGVDTVTWPSALNEFDLVVSTIPPLSETNGWFSGLPHGTLLDVAYSPWPSALARKWLESGSNVVSGLEMLIWQAIGQLRIFRNGSVAESFEIEEKLAEAMRSAANSES